jgi:predicted lactoylglutathione lyase
MNSQFPAAVPEIPVTNIDDAVLYYRECLGFKHEWGSQELGLAGIARGSCRMFLANQEFREGYGNVGPIMIWLNTESEEEVDELYTAWALSEAKLISAPESKPWRLYEFTMADPDGNLFRVFFDLGGKERLDATIA